MSKLILVSGPTGVGKTTYSIGLSREINAINFSIDSWMQILFNEDMKSMDFRWIMERVNRCHKQIWEISAQILKNDNNVILDLGFTTKEQRNKFMDLAKAIKINPEIHFLSANVNTRKERVRKRNLEKDPELYSFEVTDQMFEFMEPRFESPAEEELQNGTVINL